jgi:uncharacterized protein
MGVPWEITPQKVQAAVDRIVETARPLRIILFGSYVRGQVHRNSDLDILVVADDPVENPRQESVRIRRALRGIGMPMDILVVADHRLRELADAPGLIYREALREGKVVYDRKE